MIVPALTDHMYSTFDTVGETVTVNVIGSPGMVKPAGPMTVIVGHCPDDA